MDEPDNKGLYYCRICDARAPNEASFESHLKGKRHAQSVERARIIELEAEKSLFITNFQHIGVAELTLTDYFANYGAISKIRVDKNKGNFAILEFVEKESVAKVLEVEHHQLLGQEIIVKPREVKLPTTRRATTERRQVIHNQMPQALWSMLMSAENFEAQFHVISNNLTLNDDEKHVRDLVCQLLETALEEVFPSCKIQAFGSSATDIGFHDCDMDLNFSYNSFDHHAATQFVEQFRADSLGCSQDTENSDFNKNQVLEAVASIIKSCIPDCYQVKAILTARRPVVKFRHRTSNMRCDLSVGNRLAVRNTEFIQHLCRTVLYFSSLVQAIRLWTKHWNLSGSQKAASPLLNNYSVTLMVIFYLYQCGELHTIDYMRSHDTHLEHCVIDSWDCTFSKLNPRIKNDTEKSLLEMYGGFFRFYSKFDFRNKILCLKSGQQQSVERCKAETTEQATLPFKYGHLNIRDPFELNHNVAGNVGQKHVAIFVKCFRNTALACEMKAFLNKPTAHLKDPWGIMTTFVDHHTKRLSSESSTQTIEMDISDMTETQQTALLPLIITILTDVFMVKIIGSDDEEENADSKASLQMPVSLNAEQIPSCEPSNTCYCGHEPGTRKRRMSDSTPTAKRAKLQINSPEALKLHSKAQRFGKSSTVKFPMDLKCDVNYRVWEGRRKVRRQLVKPGITDVLDLERQISELLISGSQPQNESPNASMNSNDTLDISTFFRVNLVISKESEKLALCFRHDQNCSNCATTAGQDFKNFIHHLAISLPSMIRKCLRTK